MGCAGLVTEWQVHTTREAEDGVDAARFGVPHSRERLWPIWPKRKGQVQALPQALTGASSGQARRLSVSGRANFTRLRSQPTGTYMTVISTRVSRRPRSGLPGPNGRGELSSVPNPQRQRMTAPKAKGRCAIYTRKSSEEGLEQSFNSLHAQREACEAYILSQRHEGWQVVCKRMSGGGCSLRRTRLSHDFPANREFCREMREYSGAPRGG
jgi:hypothetical protein